MIEEILPRVVAAVDLFDDVPDAVLFPEEEALVAGAVDKRRREFATGRACARAALTALGIPNRPLLAEQGGGPAWPAGLVGSITHCEGYRAAAVAPDRDVITLGIDAEPNSRLPPGVLEMVADAREQSWVAQLAAADPTVCWDTLLFSAKEAVYKAWFPIAKSWLDFTDVTVTLERTERAFCARLVRPAAARLDQRTTSFNGRWMVRRGLVATAICVPRAGLVSGERIGVVDDPGSTVMG